MKLAMIVFLAALLLMLVTTAASAQLQPRDFGVFFEDEHGDWRATSAFIEAFQPSRYGRLIAYDIGPAAGWEAWLDISDRAWNFAVVLNPPCSLGGRRDPGNWIVGFGACLEASGDHRLATLQIGYYRNEDPGNDVLICLGPSTPTSFDPPTPGYSSCTDELIPFTLAANGNGNYPDGCAVINPTLDPPIPSAAWSWGAVKAEF